MGTIVHLLLVMTTMYQTTQWHWQSYRLFPWYQSWHHSTLIIYLHASLVKSQNLDCKRMNIIIIRLYFSFGCRHRYLSIINDDNCALAMSKPFFQKHDAKKKNESMGGTSSEFAWGFGNNCSRYFGRVCRCYTGHKGAKTAFGALS